MISRSIPTGQRQGCRSCNSPILEGDAFCAVCGARYDVPTESGAIKEMWASILRTLEQSTSGELEFIREIGRGGMGTVYLARQIDLDRLVAIKVLSPAWLTNETMVERFRREARMIASIRHPSIVNVHGVGQTADVHYFVMDFIEGVSLSRVLRIHGQMGVPVTRAIMYQVGAALGYAHRPERGIIHRDIKPGNIMLDTEGNAIVTDFGIARASDASSGLTMTGLIMGTPEYMSPEQCRGDDVTPASDQYSLGTVLYGMLTGSPPFTGTDYQILIKQTTEPIPPLRSVRPDCPKDLAEAIERMLAKDPAERWPTVMAGVKAAGGTPLHGDDPIRHEIMSLVGMAKPVSASADTIVAPRSVASPADSDTKPTWLRILAVPEELAAGDQVDLRATCVLGDGTEQEGADVVWESTNPGIARIDPSTGRLVAVGTGATIITARAEGVAQSVTVNVSVPKVTRLTLQPRHLDLKVGATAQVAPTMIDARGRTVSKPVQWSSSNPAVATVAEDGSIQALKEGSTSILALCDSAGAATSVTVIKALEDAVGMTGVPGDPTGVTHEVDGTWPHPGEVADISRLDSEPREPPTADDESWVARPWAAATGTGESGTYESGEYTRVQGGQTAPELGWEGEATGGDPGRGPGLLGGGSETPEKNEGVQWKAWWAAVPVALLAAVAVLVFGFGGDGEADAANAAAVASLILTVPDSVAVGQSIPLAAAAVTGNGDTASALPTWTSSDPTVLQASAGTAVGLAPGAATITAQAESARESTRVVVFAPAAASGPGRLRVAALVSGVDLDPNGFRVTVDGRNAGSVAAGSELTVRELEAGSHAVRLTGVASNCRVAQGAARDVDVRAGAVVTLEYTVECSRRPDPAPTPDPGTLQLRITPYGAVTVGGTAHGDRTRLGVELPAGSHQLSIVRAGYQSVNTTVTIQPGATLNLICRLGEQESSCRNP